MAAKQQTPTDKRYDKRFLIQQANSHIFITLIVSSIVVSAGLVTSKILWDQRSYQARVIAAQEKARDQLIANIANAAELQKSYSALEASDVKAELVLDALPSKYDFPALASSMEKVVGASGLTLASFGGTDDVQSAVPSTNTPTPLEIPFTLNVQGTYSAIQGLVKSLDRSIRPFRVDSMTLSGTNSDMQAILNITTFYQPSTSLEIGTEVIK